MSDEIAKLKEKMLLITMFKSPPMEIFEIARDTRQTMFCMETLQDVKLLHL